MKAFQCKMCGDCCYGEGGIYLEQREIDDIARFLEMTPNSFLSRYCEENHCRYQLKTGHDRFCVFFHKEKRCLIHPVKPKLCILWPFSRAIVSDKENWEMAKDACPGINLECTFEEFVRQSKE